MEVLLDTNFIISCVKRKIDFLAQLEENGFKVILPTQVFQELKDLRFKVSHEDRTAIKFALDILIKNKVKKASLGGSNVDEGLITLGKKGAYVATLDSAIKRAVPRRVGISQSQQKIIIEQD